MSLDFLFEIERAVDSAKNVYGCVSLKSNQWNISSKLEDLRQKAKQSAGQKRSAVTLYQLLNPTDAQPQDMFLVPTRIGDDESEPSQIEWSVVDTAEAADMMMDMRHGKPPFFGLRLLETVAP